MRKALDVRKLYKFDVYRAHRTRVARKYFDLYAWFWFHTEIWLNPPDRRPYTLIMKDWIFPHLPYFITIICAWYAGMTVWVIFSILNVWMGGAVAALLISSFSGWLGAHLVWGRKWIPGEQEDPPVIDI